MLTRSTLIVVSNVQVHQAGEPFGHALPSSVPDGACSVDRHIEQKISARLVSAVFAIQLSGGTSITAADSAYQEFRVRGVFNCSAAT